MIGILQYVKAMMAKASTTADNIMISDANLPAMDAIMVEWRQKSKEHSH